MYLPDYGPETGKKRDIENVLFFFLNYGVIGTLKTFVYRDRPISGPKPRLFKIWCDVGVIKRGEK
jgi:hypothetical protein